MAVTLNSGQNGCGFLRVQNEYRQAGTLPFVVLAAITPLADRE
jgi:hypothetical protein